MLCQSPWKLRIEESHDGVVVRVPHPAIHLGENNADVYKMALYGLTEQVPPGEVRLDFGNIASISSVILGILLTFRRKLLDERGAKLTLFNVRPEVHEILDVTQLTRLFLPQTQCA